MLNQNRPGSGTVRQAEGGAGPALASTAIEEESFTGPATPRRPAGTSLRARLAAIGDFLARPGVQATILLAFAVGIRIWRWTNPAVQVDEEFYLLVGDRMLHGALPFVDIWDRKPVGLFLLFAAIRWVLGGEGIIQYHVVATLFAAATAFTIARIATRIASAPAAILGGIAYLIWLDVFGGEGGQAPVFYNLFMAVAGLLTLRAIMVRPGSFETLRKQGVVVMLICGLAIQIKYTAVFEGIFFGLVFLGRAWPLAQRRLDWVAAGAIWVACGILPTLAAYLWFAAIGASQIFIYSNFTSVFNRVPSPPGELLTRLWLIVRYALPLLIGSAVVLMPGSPVHRPVRDDRIARRFVAGWAASAVAGLLIFGSYYDHYFLPVLVPLTIATAPLIGDWRVGVALTAGARRLQVPVGLAIMIAGIVTAQSVVQRNVEARGRRYHMDRLVAAIKPHLDNCMFVYDGEPILYYLTGSCFPTRYPFPDHLNNKVEVGAIGVDANQEVRRILANKPTIVVSSDAPAAKTNLQTWAIVEDALARDYKPIASVQIGRGYRIVYQRLPGH